MYFWVATHHYVTRGAWCDTAASVDLEGQGYVSVAPGRGSLHCGVPRHGVGRDTSTCILSARASLTLVIRSSPLLRESLVVMSSGGGYGCPSPPLIYQKPTYLKPLTTQVPRGFLPHFLCFWPTRSLYFCGTYSNLRNPTNMNWPKIHLWYLLLWPMLASMMYRNHFA
jgi:hypothetical protein